MMKEGRAVWGNARPSLKLGGSAPESALQLEKEADSECGRQDEECQEGIGVGAQVLAPRDHKFLYHSLGLRFGQGAKNPAVHLLVESCGMTQKTVDFAKLLSLV